MDSALARGLLQPQSFAADEKRDRWYKYGFLRLEQSDVLLAVLMPAGFQQPLVEFTRSVVLGSVLAAAVAALIAWMLATTVTQP